MFCQTFKATISCNVCIKRQSKAKQLGRQGCILSGNFSFVSCLDCPCGKELTNNNCKKDKDVFKLKKDMWVQKLKRTAFSTKPKRFILRKGQVNGIL